MPTLFSRFAQRSGYRGPQLQSAPAVVLAPSATIILTHPKMFKRPVPIIAVVVAVILVGFALRQCRSGSNQNFQTVAVTRGPITQAVTATGTRNRCSRCAGGSQVSGNIQSFVADF